MVGLVLAKQKETKEDEPLGTSASLLLFFQPNTIFHPRENIYPAFYLKILACPNSYKEQSESKFC